MERFFIFHPKVTAVTTGLCSSKMQQRSGDTHQVQPNLNVARCVGTDNRPIRWLISTTGCFHFVRQLSLADDLSRICISKFKVQEMEISQLFHQRVGPLARFSEWRKDPQWTLFCLLPWVMMWIIGTFRLLGHRSNVTGESCSAPFWLFSGHSWRPSKARTSLPVAGARLSPR